MLKLDINNEILIAEAKAAIEQAIASAPVPVAVTKRISAFAVRHRNRGRDAAIRHHQFEGMCEASSKPLDRRNTHLYFTRPKLTPTRSVNEDATHILAYASG